MHILLAHISIPHIVLRHGRRHIASLLPLQPTTFHILLSLTDEDRHGYAIILEVVRRTQGELKLSAGTLYRSIQRMLESGLITETRSRPAPEMDDERRRYYRMTPLGSGSRGGSGTPARLTQNGALVRRRAQDYLLHFYRLLLHLYPASFRAEYGDVMSAIFALELDRRSGLAARCRLWFGAFAEIVFNAALVHWEVARHDLFHSARSLLGAPGFSLTAVLLVTIGIGANVAVFTLANFVLVRPLPFPQPERLTKVWEKHPGYSRMELSPANYRDVIASSTSFTALAAFNSISMSLVGQGEPQRIDGAWVPKDLVIQSSQPAERLLPAIRQIIHQADPEQPISNIRTIEDVLAGETGSRTLQMRVLVVLPGWRSC
jgi:DNA-binding MarR family transcriptional regulator